jgi:hypothetical protein
MLSFCAQRRSHPLKNPLEIYAIVAESFYTGGKTIAAEIVLECLTADAIGVVIA